MTKLLVKTVVAIAAASLTLTACGVSTESSPRDLPPEVVQGLASPSPAPADQGATRFVPLWFVNEGRLVEVDRKAEDAFTDEDRLAALEAGPTQEEINFGLRTAVTPVIPDQPLVQTATSLDISVDTGPGEVAVVLSEGFDQLPSEEQLLVLGQVVLTLTSGPTDSVLFVDESGTVIGVPLPDGRLVNRAVTAQDYRSLRAVP